MMCKTADPQDLKLVGEDIITQWKFITNLYQLDAFGRGFSGTIVPISNSIC